MLWKCKWQAEKWSCRELSRRTSCSETLPCIPKTENCSVQQPAFQSYTTKGGGEKGVEVKWSFSLTSDLLGRSYKQAKCSMTCSRAHWAAPCETHGHGSDPCITTTSRTSKHLLQHLCHTPGCEHHWEFLRSLKSKEGLKSKVHFPVTQLSRCRSWSWSSLLRVELPCGGGITASS